MVGHSDMSKFTDVLYRRFRASAMQATWQGLAQTQFSLFLDLSCKGNAFIKLTQNGRCQQTKPKRLDKQIWKIVL